MKKQKIETSMGGRLTHSSQFLPSLISLPIRDIFPIFGHNPTSPEISLISLFLQLFGQDLVKILVLFFLLSSLYVTSAASHEDLSDAELIQILKKEYSDWEGNRTEKLIFICQDGQIFRFGGSKHRISIQLADIIRLLARNGNNMATISVIVHNHRWPDDFSNEDKAFFKTLRHFGFQGRFLLFYPEKHMIRELTDPDS